MALPTKLSAVMHLISVMYLYWHVCKGWIHPEQVKVLLIAKGLDVSNTDRGAANCDLVHVVLINMLTAGVTAGA